MGHLKALLTKNYLLWKRNSCCAIMEILFPIFFLSLIIIIRASTDSKDIPQKSYLQKSPEIGEYLPQKLYPSFPPSMEHEPLETKLSLGPIMKNCINYTVNGEPANNGYIVLAPKNSITEGLEKLFLNYGYKSKYFNTLEEINNLITSPNYPMNFCLGITFQTNNNIKEKDVYTYRIHYNTTQGEIYEIPDPSKPSHTNFLKEDIETNILPWINSGFLTIQNWIDNLILQKETNSNLQQISVKITSQRVQKHKKDPFFTQIGNDFPTFTILPLVIIYLRLMNQILLEKEQKIREMMQIMGLKNSYFYLSWIIHYSIIYLIIIIISSIIINGIAFPNSDITIILIIYILFALNAIFQALTVTTLFSKANLGMIAGLVLYFGCYIVTNVVSGNDSMSFGMKALLSLIPQVAFSLSGKVFGSLENDDQGVNWDNLGEEVNNYRIDICMIMMFISLIVYIMLFLYLDQVVPNEFGVKKHPLFCLKRKRKRNIQYQQTYQNIEHNDENVEEVEGILKEKEKNGEAIIVKNLKKVFGNGKKAVDNLNLKMYKDHISCFLGHNGAGKTTTISMLIGMLDITSGSATAFGYDVQNDMSELRKIMGVCPQHDILYGDLTVQEHLELFAVFKGMKDTQKIKKEIDQILSDVDLTFKRDDLSKNLSGGQKRRLSVGMAFIGGSKLVYLDEPTSGCDTSVRRSMWDMLRKYKQDRIIVLTTHFMDEADFLGDRISIIGGGKLLCSGSTNYLKNKFGVGYNLTIVKDNTTIDSQPIIDTVMKHIDTAKKVSDVSSELAFQLKMTEIDKFQPLFDELDAQKQNLHISNYGISITTMEEVFLKVGHMTQEDMNTANSFVRQNSAKETIKKLKSSRIQQQQSLQNDQKPHKIDDNFDLNNVRIKDPFKLFINHFLALLVKRFHFFKRDRKGIFCELVLPCLFTILGLWSLTMNLVGEYNPYTLQPSLLGSNQKILYGGTPSIPQSEIEKLTSNFPSNDFKLTHQPSTSLADFDQKHFNQRSEDLKGSFYFSELTATDTSYLILAESLNKDVLPLYINQMNQAILREKLNKDQLELTVVVSPWVKTDDVKGSGESGKGIAASFTFGMLLSFIPTSLIAYILMERECQIKHQQLVSGVGLKAYWFSNYGLDALKYFFPYCLFAICMFWAFDLKTYTKTFEVFSSVIVMFVLYGLSIVPWTYATSFLFKTQGNAQVMTFFVNFLMGSLFPLILFILRTFVKKAKPYALAVSWIFRLFPSFCFGNSMLNIASRNFFVLIYDDIESIQSPYNIEIAGGDMIIMVLIIPLSFAVIFLFEYMKSQGTLDKLLSKGQKIPQYKPKLQDDDVKREEQIVKSKNESQYVIKLDQVRKVFKKGNAYFEAVDNVSVGIDKGECFTLLGVNGAGKTTLFKILTGDHLATSGKAYINGYNVTTEMAKARYNIGYCPQFDALLANLTTREHLELYASIKGIPANMRKEIIDQKIVEMDLQKFEHIPAGTYSGGNKRKLSVAIAMIGNPPVVLLDEPSTGMDPKARRFMWDVISRISTQNKSSSIVLTTHSMEEAEALSTKMVIMVQGNFKCLGSIQNIKSKFGQGYEVEIKLNIPSDDKRMNMVKKAGLSLESVINSQNFKQIMQKLNLSQYEQIIAPGQVGADMYKQIFGVNGLKLTNLVEFFLLEFQAQQLNAFIGKTFGQFSVIEHFGAFSRFKILTDYPIGQMFGKFQASKQELDIASYSVKQTTIEAIFNNFATGKINTADFNKGGQFYKDFSHQDQVKLDQQNVEVNEHEISKAGACSVEQVKIEENIKAILE